ncbi:MAG: RNase H family protein [Paraglaciecola sp.]|uniref:RNase H family protein n=1 Tax=Paraglaciecola sp. TaxID=1920173 RepID=UPI003266E26C
MQLFIDASVDPKSKVGHGAYLLLSRPNSDLSNARNAIKTKRFEQTSSTKLELQTLLFALNEINTSSSHSTIYLTVFTDSQNIVNLPKRRDSIEQKNYTNRAQNHLKHHLLYKEFYRLTSIINCDFVKVKGHKAAKYKDDIDRVFSLVDIASRRALRKEF